MPFDPHWFNKGGPTFWVGGRLVRLWNLFKRRGTVGRWWGVGLLQIGARHLVFVGRTQGMAEPEVWDVDLLFRKLR